MMDWDALKEFFHIPLSIHRLKTKEFWLEMITDETTSIWGSESEISGMTIFLSPIKFLAYSCFWIFGTIITIILLPYGILNSIKFSYESKPSELSKLFKEQSSSNPKNCRKTSVFDRESDIVKSNLFDENGCKTDVFYSGIKECDNLEEILERRNQMPF